MCSVFGNLVNRNHFWAAGFLVLFLMPFALRASLLLQCSLFIIIVPGLTTWLNHTISIPIYLYIMVLLHGQYCQYRMIDLLVVGCCAVYVLGVHTLVYCVITILYSLVYCDKHGIFSSLTVVRIVVLVRLLLVLQSYYVW